MKTCYLVLLLELAVLRLKISQRREFVWVEEVQQAPQLFDRVLQGSACDEQPVDCFELCQRLVQHGLVVFKTMCYGNKKNDERWLRDGTALFNTFVHCQEVPPYGTKMQLCNTLLRPSSPPYHHDHESILCEHYLLSFKTIS